MAKAQPVDVAEFMASLALSGGFVSGVPCSGLKSLIQVWSSHPRWRHVPATNEAEAVALAIGASAVGSQALVYMQNSGLGYALEALASLVIPSALPLTVVISHRGSLDDEDVPQHRVMGRITADILKLLNVPVLHFDPGAGSLGSAESDGGSLRFVVLPPHLNWISSAGSRPQQEARSEARAQPPRSSGKVRYVADRVAVLRVLEKHLRADAIVVTSPGYVARDLCATADRSRNLYLLGAMGLTGVVALGINCCLPDQDTVAIDGDGSLLLHLGGLATIGGHGGRRFRHLVMDNGVHASTGGQPTSSRNVAFAELALACGYANAKTDRDFRSLDEAMVWMLSTEGPVLLHVGIEASLRNPSPRVDLHPKEQVDRLRRALAATEAEPPACRDHPK